MGSLRDPHRPPPWRCDGDPLSQLDVIFLQGRRGSGERFKSLMSSRSRRRRGECCRRGHGRSSTPRMQRLDWSWIGASQTVKAGSTGASEAMQDLYAAREVIFPLSTEGGVVERGREGRANSVRQPELSGRLPPGTSYHLSPCQAFCYPALWVPLVQATTTTAPPRTTRNAAERLRILSADALILVRTRRWRRCSRSDNVVCLSYSGHGSEPDRRYH